MSLCQASVSLALAAFIVAGPAPAQQSYPDRTVTIVAPAAPGGLYSIFARLIGSKLEQRLGKTFIVENRPGAGSIVGVLSVIRSAPNGYTLMVANSTGMATNVTLYKNLPYDPTADLAPIAPIARIPDVPPLTEIGVKNFDATSWFMLVAPARTPKEIIDRIHAELRRITGDAEVRQEFIRLGLVPVNSPSPEDLEHFVQSEIARWGDIVRKAGLAGSE